ncbi:MAG TPA: beta-N-acetylhexosaminidase [Burkholderiaceae bacterium]|nr:beta-N-acetylhexosaminidase [Burkholderiaceae bacterium]
MAVGPVVVGLEGTLELTAADRERLAHPLVGMVILFSRNFETPAQLCRLTDEIHALRAPPLLIAVDHEGGRVQRFRTGFTRLPAMRRLGHLWEKDVLGACRAAASLGYVLASELRAHGVDFSFTPVLDVDWGRSDVIGDRAFHSDPRVVAMLAAHLSHGLALAGMANCGKHYPGHGWAEADSHVAIPHDGRSEAEILSQDAAPYRWLGPQLAAVMPAHVIYDAVDAAPAGFSVRWMDVLRRDLGFTGAAFTDDLLMEGASKQGSVPDRAAAGLAAGCDLVLVCNDSSAMDAVLNQLTWRRTAQFDQRFARLRPRGPAYPMTELVRTELYEGAKADLLRLAEDD